MQVSLVNHQIGIIAFLFVCLVILITNFLVLHRLGSKSEHNQSDPNPLPSLSILIPARNEEDSIRNCVLSLVEQDYPDFEVIVLNDHSTDATGMILSDLAAISGKFRYIEGMDIPPGWLGKNWACHQLSEVSKGSLLLFTDADTNHKSNSARLAVQAMFYYGCDFLSILPFQVVRTFGEKLLVPLLYWYTQSFIPLICSYRIPATGLSAAIGQFMLIRRDIYQDIGGYAAIRDRAADDLALVRLVKSNKHKWRLFDGTLLVQCRMYQNFSQVFSGFSKNFFAAFGHRIIPYTFVWLWIAIVFLEPPTIIFMKILHFPILGASFWLAIVASLEAFLLWGLTLWRFRFPVWIIAFYPFSVLLSEIVAVKSMISTLTGQAEWKGRKIDKPEISWF